MLTLFKLGLLAILIIVAYMMIFRVKVLLVQRIGALSFGLILFLFILFPDLSTRVAHKVGIGRGVDLILYISQALLAYLIARLYVRVQEVNAQLSELIRAQALAQAKAPEDRLSRAKHPESRA